MEMRQFTVDGHDVRFVNEWKDSRSGFNHISSLFVDNEFVSTATVHYINRTWERYSYQTSMMKCVDNWSASIEENLKYDFKRFNNLTRISGKNKDEFNVKFKENKQVKLCEHILEALK